MVLITEKTATVLLWRGIFDSIEFASSTFASRAIFKQKKKLLIYHDIDNCSRSGHTYWKCYFRLFLKHCNIWRCRSMETAARDRNTKFLLFEI